MKKTFLAAFLMAPAALTTLAVLVPTFVTVLTLLNVYRMLTKPRKI